MEENIANGDRTTSPNLEEAERFPDHRRPSTPPVNVLGTPVDAWTLSPLLDLVVDWALHPQGMGKTILYANVHVLNTAYTDVLLLNQLCAASTVYCDGSGVRLGANLLGARLPPRMTGADWIDHLCSRACDYGLSLFLLGSGPGVAESAARVLRSRHPALRIAGTHHGFADESDISVIHAINRSSAHILLIGMGTPRQELWIGRHRGRIEIPVTWAVGALFDFVAGIERRGPQWALDHHLEWAARLMAKPAAHWRRYLIGNPLFVARVVRQRLLGVAQAPRRYCRRESISMRLRCEAHTASACDSVRDAGRVQRASAQFKQVDAFSRDSPCLHL